MTEDFSALRASPSIPTELVARSCDGSSKRTISLRCVAGFHTYSAQSIHGLSLSYCVRCGSPLDERNPLRATAASSVGTERSEVNQTNQVNP